MNESIDVLRKLARSDFVSELRALPVSRKISQFSRELFNSEPGIKSVISVGPNDLRKEITVNLEKPLSIKDLKAEFGDYEVHYNPRDDYSVVRFDSFASSAAEFEFIVHNKLKMLDDGRFCTVDPKGSVVIAPTESPLESVIVKFLFSLDS